MFCPNCRKELSEGTRFCGGCGTRIAPPEQPVPSPEPIRFTEPVKFSEPVFDPPVPTMMPPAADAAPVAAPRAKKAKAPKSGEGLVDKVKKTPAKYLKIGGIAAGALVLVIILICVLPGLLGGSAGGNGSGLPEGALYLKDSQLYYSDFSRNAPYEISDDLLDDASNASLRSYASRISSTIHVTEDGKTMFFLDKLSSDSTGTLYYRSLTNFKQEAEKIAAGVSRYTVSENGKLVTYLKNGTLYQYNMKEETKIAKDVVGYRVSGDGKIIYYKNDEGAWYVTRNGENEKIGTDISIEYITDDYATIYYMNDEKLYRKTIGKDKEKLLSGVDEISDIGEDGTFYYTIEESFNLSEFFKEDTEEYDGLMESLQDADIVFYKVGYFNGKEGTIIAKGCGELDSVSYSGGMILLYNQYEVSAVSTTGLTELVQYYYDSDHYYVVDAAEEMVENQLLTTQKLCFAIDGSAGILELEELYDLCVSSDGKTMYALCEVDENSEGVMYQITLSGSTVKSVDEVDDSVYSERGFYFTSSGEYFIYYKDVKDYEGDLYANGVLVDSDVYTRKTVYYNEAGKELLYFADYNSDKSYGTLKSWDGKSAVGIYDEVVSFSLLSSGDVLVGYDYDADDDTGTLAIWNGKKLTEICEDVYNCTEVSGGDLLISTDYSTKNYSYTLSVWNGKKLTQISEDVYSYTFLPNGDILYLYDYSTSKYEGELYLYNGKKSELVDEDVVALITLPGTMTHYFSN